ESSFRMTRSPIGPCISTPLLIPFVISLYKKAGSRQGKGQTLAQKKTALHDSREIKGETQCPGILG
ncbi:MAG: hypothetical protein VW235_11520, partial [Rhodospirillaceae bacterium]